MRSGDTRAATNPRRRLFGEQEGAPRRASGPPFRYDAGGEAIGLENARGPSRGLEGALQ